MNGEPKTWEECKRVARESAEKLRTQGWPWSIIAERLNIDGIERRNGRPWNSNAVRRLVNAMK